MVATVFVGNLPWDVNEQQLRGLFADCGQVVAFRLVTDVNTGKMKGYGFCEYRERESAVTAMRTLNGREVNGRNIRVDFADGGAAKSAAVDTGGVSAAGVSIQAPPGQGVGVDAARAAAAAAASFLGASGGAGGDEAVNVTLGAMSKAQLFEVMSQMKALAAQNKSQARDILVSNPQLCRALFQAQVMLGMVGGGTQGMDGTAVVAEAVAMDAAEGGGGVASVGGYGAGMGGRGAQTNGAGPGGGPMRAPAMQQPMQQPQFVQPPPPQQFMPAAAPMQPQQPQQLVAPVMQQPPAQCAQPPQMQQPQFAPQMMPQQQQQQHMPPGGGVQMDPNMQESLIRQVMSMSQEEIAQLPDAQRMQVMQIIQLMQGRV